VAQRNRLADRLEQLGIPRNALARLVGVNESTVYRWLSGESDPRDYQRGPLAGAIQVPLDQLNWYLARDAEPAPAPMHDGDVDRRDFLAGVTGSLAFTVAALEQTAMSSDASPGQQHTVLRLLGHAHHAAGDAAFDRLDLAAAADHFHQAHQIAVELGDADMMALAAVELGDVARRQARYNVALRHLDSAARHAASGGMLIRVKQCQTLARAFAEMGDRSSFDRAIGQAEDLAGQISPEHHREGDHSPRGIRLERGQGLTLLGDAEAALAIYERSAPPAFRSERERGSFTIIHAQALAAAGHLDEGVRLAIEGLQLANGYDSLRHVSRVQRMYDRLAGTWSSAEPALVELRAALAA
jgi:transcriptional regulator with XRE-family HTH domain